MEFTKMVFAAFAMERATRLLRSRLSPQQLLEFDRPRPWPPGWSGMPPGVTFRWFNVQGSLQGHYTIWGPLDARYAAQVGLGHNNPSRDYCVYSYGVRKSDSPMPDQMLAFKLALETDERDFQAHAVPISAEAATLRQQIVNRPIVFVRVQ